MQFLRKIEEFIFPCEKHLIKCFEDNKEAHKKLNDKLEHINSKKAIQKAV